jgi:uncharacterized membrane-anchored protein
VGLLELFAGHGQNRFYRELEEWLSSITRVGFSSADGEGTTLSPVLDGLSGQLDELHSHYGAFAEERSAIDARLARLTDALEALALRLDISQGADPALERIAEGQERVAALLEQRAPGADLGPLVDGQARLVKLMEEAGAGTLDAESRLHLRSIDAHLLRILEEMAAGRQEAVDDLRGELAQLSRVIRQLSAGRRHDPPTPIVGRRV